MATVYMPLKNQGERATEVEDISGSSVNGEIRLLGNPSHKRWFSFQRNREQFDANTIATQPSVYDDPQTAIAFQPRPDWESLRAFDPSARWTWAEEYAVIRKVDFRVMAFTCVMFMALELDRSNLQQALTDDFLKDLGMNTNGQSSLQLL